MEREVFGLGKERTSSDEFTERVKERKVREDFRGWVDKLNCN
jgi:hypothetical protein